MSTPAPIDVPALRAALHEAIGHLQPAISGAEYFVRIVRDSGLRHDSAADPGPHFEAFREGLARVWAIVHAAGADGDQRQAVDPAEEVPSPEGSDAA